MIRSIPTYGRHPRRIRIHIVATILLLSLFAGCVQPPQKPVGISVEEVARLQRMERAQANLRDGLKKYDGGNNDEAIKSFLLALDSGQLAFSDQINARKHMAFIYCLSGREANCKEEFEKIIALDAKFELSQAEAGHPTWGPIFRLTRTEIDLRKSGRGLPATPSKAVPPGEKLLAEGMEAYDVADYNKAIKSFQDALKETLSATNQVLAHKFIAFSYCLTYRTMLCRIEFEAVIKADPNFDLAPAEAGHPYWGTAFRDVKSKQKNTVPKKQ